MDINALLQNALEAHRRGDLNAAKKGYQAVLDHDPEQPDTLALMGILHSNMGSHEEALTYVQKAVKLDPKAALFKVHLGNVLAASGDVLAAIDAFEGARALAPDKPEIIYNLGNAYREAEKWDEAEVCYKSVLQVAPQHVQSRNNLALVYEHRKELDKAIAELRKAVEDEPRYTEGWLNLCSVLEVNEDYEESIKAGEHAKLLEPHNPKGWFGIGVAYCRMEKHAEAIPYYLEALRLKPDWEMVWDNLGQSYQQVCDIEKAEQAFKKCIQCAGQFIENEDGRFVDEKEYGNRYWHLALLELLKGDYKRGFAHYRSRFEELEGLSRQKWSRPVWKGEDIAGKTILVMEEQGAGDFLMMARYVPELKKRGAKVILYTSKALEPLFAGWHMVDQIVLREGTIPDFDYYCMIFDLPFCFETTVDTVPNQVPYLPIHKPDEATMLPDQGKKRVGVVWAGAPLHRHDGRRTIPLEKLLPLFDEEICDFYSLNLDKREGDEELLAKTDNITDLAPKLKSFSDTAKFMAQMDLVITVDTSTAHLAGGLGRNVWALIPFSPDWRWLLGRDDSPWYPTLQLFRQDAAGEWEPVIQRVKEGLRAL